MKKGRLRGKRTTRSHTLRLVHFLGWPTSCTERNGHLAQGPEEEASRSGESREWSAQQRSWICLKVARGQWIIDGESVSWAFFPGYSADLNIMWYLSCYLISSCFISLEVTWGCWYMPQSQIREQMWGLTTRGVWSKCLFLFCLCFGKV